jgi:hypothetical protein
MIQKALFAASVLLLAAPSYALDFYCTPRADKSCEERIVTTLETLGCEPDANTIECRPSSEENKEWCKVEVNKCSSPTSDLFGLNADAVYCYGDDKKVSLKIDGGLSLTWSFGVFRDYIHDVCLDK